MVHIPMCLRACVPKQEKPLQLESRPCSLQLEKAHVQQWRACASQQRPSTAKLKKKKRIDLRHSARCPGTIFISSKMLNTSYGRDTSMTNDQGIHLNQQPAHRSLGSKNCPTHLMGSAEHWAWSRYSAYLQKRRAKLRQQEVREGLVTHSQPSVQSEPHQQTH